jgi:hypothetical protein
MMNSRDVEQLKGWALKGMVLVGIVMAIATIVPSGITTYQFFFGKGRQHSKGVGK